MATRAECSSEPTTGLDNIAAARNNHDNRQTDGFDEDFPEDDEANVSICTYEQRSILLKRYFSIRSDIEDYYWENGRRYHAMGGGRYLLPNDDTELDREDMKHHMWTLVLEGCLHLAPIGDHPMKILDVGTGSGIWAMQAADQYPSAEVIGFDISPVQPSWSVPEVELFLAGLRREMKDSNWQIQDQAGSWSVLLPSNGCLLEAAKSFRTSSGIQQILVSLAIPHSTHLAISINIHTTVMASPSRSGGTMHVAVTSPFKFLMGSSHSAPDVSVNALVDRFTTLEVKDRDEDSAKRAVRRLEAALRRAEMAREEAETEATGLRDELREQRDMAEERLREKMDLRQRLDEYEKKYEKAKERFKQQKVKHEEQLRKMQKEYMEREKLHWRQQQLLQEEVDWEKKLRADSNDLIAFLEIDHIVALQAQKDKHLELLAKQQRVTPNVQLPQESLDDFDIEIDTPKKQEDEAMAEDNDYAVEDSPEPEITRTSSNHTPVRSHSSTPIAHDSPQHTTSPPRPSAHTKQTLRVPINFNDEDDSSSTSDKENSLPLLQPPRTPNPSSRTVSAPPHHLKTPMTISCSTPASHPNIPDFLNTPIDREAALAAIRERRGRARSNGAAGMATPRRLGRDASAPPGAGSVGSRSKSRGP
ncbi:hypothetical protein E4T42_07608 [Aureobasidium subglaciale]|nr:hypothetical protein E4T42_07608 [Aureobasidium subglaciale]